MQSLSNKRINETSLHLFLTTLPFLLLFSYLLFSASKRPNLLIYHLDEISDDELQQTIKEYGIPIIALGDMLIAFILALILLCTLMVYLKYFVERRHKLMRRYSTGDKGGVVSVMGNVLYERHSGCCVTLREKYLNDYGYVTYEYPDSFRNAKMTASGIMEMETRDRTDNDQRLSVEKRVRTYHPYHRENITILLLPDLPLSGQPETDVALDISSNQSAYAEKNHDKINSILLPCGIWFVFCLFGALYILHQMEKVRDMEVDACCNVENPWLLEHLWLFFSTILVLMPLVAIGINVIRWRWYYHWVTTQGVITKDMSRVVPKTLGSDDFYNEDKVERTLECK